MIMNAITAPRNASSDTSRCVPETGLDGMEGVETVPTAGEAAIRVSYSELRKRLHQRRDIPELEREGFTMSLVAFDGRRVIRHDHPVITHVPIDAQRARHVHVAVIGEGLLEFADPPFDIAEMHVEDLFPLPEIADHVIDLFAGAIQHLGYCALAEVQPVIRILFDAD